MSQANDLLNSISEPAAGTVNEGNIVIGRDRFITVPESLKKVAVQFDHNVETVTFDCPRYWDNWDFSEMKIYVNYMREDGKIGMHLCDNVVIDDSDDTLIHFDWTISGHVTAVTGQISFLVCIKNVDSEGMEITHWNSELNADMYVSAGLKCQPTILKHYPDIITQLLVRMDYVEEIATPENMQSYVKNYFDNDPETIRIIENYIYEYLSTTYPTTEDMMQEYVNMYLDEHPPLFVISSVKPGVGCLWFDTSGGTATTDMEAIPLTANNSNGGVYAEVDGNANPVPGYNFEII